MQITINEVIYMVLKDLLKEYELKRANEMSKLNKRKQELYIRLPRLQEIEDDLNKCAIESAKAILANNSNSILENLQKNVNKLKKERILILKKDGKDLNYLSPMHDCKKCKDTGYILDNGKTSMCSCLKQKLLNSKYNNSNIGNLENENFKKFDINLYSDEINQEKYGENISPRENIKIIEKAAKNFIKNFDSPAEKNLLFSGGTGLGKTFLSNCIVAELLTAR